MNTNTLVSISLTAALAAMAGCGTDPVATASGVFPAEGFAGRNLRVEVSGDQTNWKDGATVDFGAGVTVNSVDVASPTDLFADVTIDPSATLGKNDVTVTSGGKFTLKAAFEIQSPVTLKTSGMIAQGSIGGFAIRNHDIDNPFDSTCGFSFFGQCFLYTGVTVAGPAGTNAIVSFVGDNEIDGSLFIDVDAAPAGGTLTVTSGPSDGTQFVSISGDAVAITARTAIALTANTAHNGMIVKPGDTALFSFDATAGTAVPFTVSTSAGPGLYLLPSSGHFADQLPSGASDSQADTLPQLDAVAEQAGTFYVVYADDGSMDGYAIKAAPVTLTSVASSGTAHNTEGTAQTVTKTALVTSGNLSGETDQNWYVFPVVAGDVGKHVHVTTSGDPATDAIVSVGSAVTSGGTLTDLGTSADGGYQEDYQSDVIPAGANFIYVNVAGSQAGFFVQGHGAYSAAIWLE